MKKIMFNDKYGLTKAVLEGRKTQTRRIIKQGEIIGLIDWWLDSQCEDDRYGVSFSFDSQQREGYELELTIKKKK